MHVQSNQPITTPSQAPICLSGARVMGLISTGLKLHKLPKPTCTVSIVPFRYMYTVQFMGRVWSMAGEPVEPPPELHVEWGPGEMEPPPEPELTANPMKYLYVQL